MRGSLVHDALYQLIRMEKLELSYRPYADHLLRQLCREDGMSSIRAWWAFQGVKRFGGKAAEPGTEPPIVTIWAP